MSTPSVLHGFGYADGSYFRRCMSCSLTFIGTKRSVRCEPCAESAAKEWAGLSPEQRALRRLGNQNVVSEHLAAHSRSPRITSGQDGLV